MAVPFLTISIQETRTHVREGGLEFEGKSFLSEGMHALCVTVPSFLPCPFLLHLSGFTLTVEFPAQIFLSILVFD